jgi:hypothetical protein
MMGSEIVPLTGADTMHGLGPLEATVGFFVLVFWGVIFAAAVKILRSTKL